MSYQVIAKAANNVDLRLEGFGYDREFRAYKGDVSVFETEADAQDAIDEVDKTGVFAIQIEEIEE